MIIPLDKLLTYSENKYVFVRGAMETVERVANLKNYPEEALSWKVVQNVLKTVLSEEVKYVLESPDA